MISAQIVVSRIKPRPTYTNYCIPTSRDVQLTKLSPLVATLLETVLHGV